MSDSPPSAPLSRHRIPAIDRAAKVLGVLERQAAGATIRDLAEALRLPRTSVYRIVNSLELHQIVQRATDGAYSLGPRLLALAARVQADRERIDLASIAPPVLQRIASELGESTKVSVLDGDTVLVVAAVTGRREYALAVTAGQRMPLHAGAAGKVLLASLDARAREAVLAGPLTSHTPRTLIDRQRLLAELARVRRQGWARDQGEFLVSVHAFAAPIRDRAGSIVGALSLPFLAGTEAARRTTLRQTVLDGAAAIAAAIPLPARAARGRAT